MIKNIENMIMDLSVLDFAHQCSSAPQRHPCIAMCWVHWHHGFYTATRGATAGWRVSDVADSNNRVNRDTMWAVNECLKLKNKLFSVFNNFWIIEINKTKVHNFCSGNHCDYSPWASKNPENTSNWHLMFSCAPCSKNKILFGEWGIICRCTDH